MSSIIGAGKLIGSLSSAPTISGEVSGHSSIICGKLDVSGSTYPAYQGDYEVTPKANEEQILETKNKIMQDNVTVLEVPYFETSNESGGLTVYIAQEV